MADLRMEHVLWRHGCQVIGVDEAGRGPLAGPVVAAACILPPDASLPGVDDSKRMTEKRREAAFAAVQEVAVGWGLGIVEAARIDEINILQATFEAMAQAAEAARAMAAAAPGPAGGGRAAGGRQPAHSPVARLAAAGGGRRPQVALHRRCVDSGEGDPRPHDGQIRPRSTLSTALRATRGTGRRSTWRRWSGTAPVPCTGGRSSAPVRSVFSDTRGGKWPFRWMGLQDSLWYPQTQEWWPCRMNCETWRRPSITPGAIQRWASPCSGRWRKARGPASPRWWTTRAREGPHAGQPSRRRRSGPLITRIQLDAAASAEALELLAWIPPTAQVRINTYRPWLQELVQGSLESAQTVQHLLCVADRQQFQPDQHGKWPLRSRRMRSACTTRQNRCSFGRAIGCLVWCGTAGCSPARRWARRKAATCPCGTCLPGRGSGAGATAPLRFRRRCRRVWKRGTGLCRLPVSELYLLHLAARLGFAPVCREWSAEGRPRQ